MDYFKKRSPRTKVQLSNGKRVAFEALNFELGVYKTEDPTELGELNILAKEGSAGVVKIEVAEYEELLKKKLSQFEFSKPRWKRDLLTSGGLISPVIQQNNPPPLQDVSPVAKDSDPNKHTSLPSAEPKVGKKIKAA